MTLRRVSTVMLIACVMAISGCASTKTSNTARTAKEQMLLSDAVDQSLAKVDFSPLDRQKVFVDEKYLECVDKAYVVGSVRHRIMRAGAKLVAKPEDATVVMELRSGGVGTDSSESFLGTPEIALPGMLTVPEIRIVERKSQFGFAKIGIVAYDASGNQILGSGGVTLAQSDDNNVTAFGIGPFQSGSLLRTLDQADYTPRGTSQRHLPSTVALTAPMTDGQDPLMQFASESKEVQE